MAGFLAEWYRIELTEAAVERFTNMMALAAEEVSTDAARVRLVMTVSVPADDALYGVFEAKTPEEILRTCARAGALPQRLTPRVQTCIATVPRAS
ncbi:hypothetical protein H7K45_16720 [Mycobacterium yunnanensis]|uniref:Uncharacterized protein n=1 Tax=Mycobacterium yunnanensis TaxID=368477 RepID=A0A9X3BUE8_9MYCO|nr:hypothetical protein [Mycobacterium yunnanensis]MCV7422195.1 hypothetical protein [Mycobacterium yunnanensis]